LDDQVPGKNPDPATITIGNVDGNHIVVDLGGGRYAFYAHLRKGSVAVHPGDRVHRGQVMAKLGNTGNTSAPHLHFHLMDGPSVLGSEGIPYVIDRFAVAGRIPDSAVPDDLAGDYRTYLTAEAAPRERQFPLDMDVVDFGGWPIFGGGRGSGGGGAAGGGGDVGVARGGGEASTTLRAVFRRCTHNAPSNVTPAPNPSRALGARTMV